jgi:outer membrane protein assembly factor BamB
MTGRQGDANLLSRIVRLAYLTLLALGFSLAGVPAASSSADVLAADTLPLQDAGEARWVFFGDKVLGLRPDPKGDSYVGYINAYSLSKPKFLWRFVVPLGDQDLDIASRGIPDFENNRLYIGTGQLSLLDVSTGTFKWIIPCETLGFIQPGATVLLPGDRLLTLGAKECKQKSAWDAMGKPCYSLVNAANGQVLWQYETQDLTYDAKEGHWARAGKYQGLEGGKKKRKQLEAYPISPAGRDVYQVGGAAPDRVAIAGERFESVSLADGKPLWKTKDKPGILRGAYGDVAFFQDGNELTAFNIATGAKAWKYDLKGGSNNIYTVDDIKALGHGVPEGMSDIMVSDRNVVTRISAMTGQALWSAKRGGVNWQGSVHAVLANGGDKTTAYDWNTGQKLWEVKAGSRPFGYDSGDCIVFVDAAKNVRTEADAAENAGMNYLPPYKFTVVNAKTGQVVWTKKDIDGKDIVSHSFAVPGQIRLISEKGVVANLIVADGKPGAAPEGIQYRRFVMYDEKEKELICRDFGGAEVWTLKGEMSSNGPYEVKNDYVVWAQKNGTVEVIALSNGDFQWRSTFDENPRPYLNADGTYLVVQQKKEVTIVRMGSRGERSAQSAEPSPSQGTSTDATPTDQSLK